MKKVSIKLNNVILGVAEMTKEEIRKAEQSGFTVKELTKLN